MDKTTNSVAGVDMAKVAAMGELMVGMLDVAVALGAGKPTTAVVTRFKHGLVRVVISARILWPGFGSGMAQNPFVPVSEDVLALAVRIAARIVDIAGGRDACSELGVELAEYLVKLPSRYGYTLDDIELACGGRG